MKVLLLFVVATSIAVPTVPIESDDYTDQAWSIPNENESVYSFENQFDTEHGWFLPNADNTFYWMSKQEFESMPKMFSAVTVEYYLYTNSNTKSPQQLFLNDVSTLYNSYFDARNPTRIIIHGWQNNYQSKLNTLVRDALMETGTYNIISVDWSSAAMTTNYLYARNAVSTVGKDVATFIDFLNENAAMPFNTLTLIGHSLGAHVCGFAGKQTTRGTVNVIIGLDPAYPLFPYSFCSARLCSTDAYFVESIHTNGGLLGQLQPIGQLAFYPYGGQFQNGCGLSPVCSHSRSYIYYAEAIVLDNFISIKCSNLAAALINYCDSKYSDLRMGSATNYGSSGIYYVPVNSEPHYGMG